MTRLAQIAVITRLSLMLAACGGGSTGDGLSTLVPTAGSPTDQESSLLTASDGGCDGRCSESEEHLTEADVAQIVGQVIAEAEARGLPGTVAVVDRVGNVLAVFEMADTAKVVTITSSHDGSSPVMGGLEGVNIIPATLAAIAKAITGAYLSTEGNAFSTRTASQIVQENFNPGETNQPSGPLFGVQFSQLPCGDLVQRARGGGLTMVGPHRSPLGLSADPGGFPLYKQGTPVGGVGFIGDGIYGLDRDISEFDDDLDEIIALAGTVGFDAPAARRADVITAVGKTFRYADWDTSSLLTDSASVVPISIADDPRGQLVPVFGYYNDTTIVTGTAFGTPESGIAPAPAGLLRSAAGEELDAFVLVDSEGANRFPPRQGTDQPGNGDTEPLRAEEVQVILEEAMTLANRMRAQIRRPLGTQARVSISVVDTNGAILGFARTRDGPMFGADVSLQKARTAVFFSGTGQGIAQSPADTLRGLPAPKYLAPVFEPEAVADDFSQRLVPALQENSPLTSPAPEISDYVVAAQRFLGVPNALERSGAPSAFADRSGGNLSRPHYPDGVAENPNGPLSKARGEWSVFSVGLQLDLVYNSLIQHVAHVTLDGAVPDVSETCPGNTGFDPDNLFQMQGGATQLANGIQIFPGSVPIFRGDTLVGGIGVSGDGVDQDDMISFLGVHRAGLRLDQALNNAPPAIRADQIALPDNLPRLRYVSCPQTPYLDSDEDNVCTGL